MRNLIFYIITLAVFSGAGLPKANAMDPITIAILAPYAIPVAEIAGQYALKGLGNASNELPNLFNGMVDLFMLPVGFLEVTLGAPFGLFTKGCVNIGAGCLAPLRICLSTFMLLPRMLCIYN